MQIKPTGLLQPEWCRRIPSPCFWLSGWPRGQTNWTSSDINLRWVLRMGSWNILTFSEKHRLSHLSDELSRLKMNIVGLSETRRPGSGEISSRSFTYYWSGMSNGARLKGVAIGVSRRLQPSIAEVIPVDEHIMRLRLKHTWGFMSLIAVYAPTEVCWADERDVLR